MDTPPEPGFDDPVAIAAGICSVRVALITLLHRDRRFFKARGSKALRLHGEGRNYAVGFEFHDDIVELDDADDPGLARFYQVKTRSGGRRRFSRGGARKDRRDRKKRLAPGACSTT